MKIGECMKRNVISVSPQTTIRQAANTLVTHHIGTLPVIDDERKLVGLVRMRDLINLAMPDFFKLVENLDFVPDFGAVENHRLDSATLDIPVSQIMNPPVSVDQSTGLHRAAALIQNHQMSDLPVVDRDSHLVGIASYVDIGIALVSSWG